MVFRCFTEKRPEYDVRIKMLLRELRELLGIESVKRLRTFHRYDVEGVTREVFEKAKMCVFSEPQVDYCYDLDLPETDSGWTLFVEALPGQFDQRADSCAQCIQMLTLGERPGVRHADAYMFWGDISEDEKEKIKNYLINSVECREAAPDLPLTLEEEYVEPQPVGVISGLIGMDDDGLRGVISEYSLAMDIDDLRFMRDYFRDKEGRDPTETELKVTDTYWSDHCRHTTFNTNLQSIEIEDTEVQKAFDLYMAARKEVYGERESSMPQSLMDMATIGAKTLKKRGLLTKLDESEEVNACSIRVKATTEDGVEDWLLMFKNETHNHPTEIEPFGGAATCVGGAIRDPLSGRAYVYQAMRVTGSGDPRVPIEETLEGKLPQRKITTTAAAGNASYGNQVGVATSLVHEFYHPGYVAKRMEVGALVGAAPAYNVVRKSPEPGDVVILLGGRTGRDGCGGATGSSRGQNTESVTESAAEVQKGNAPEERKILRLFRDSEVTRIIKRCNDFGAGGVSVAIGELADGLFIELDKVRKKYEGLNGTELAISESQERMAVMVDKADAEFFIKKADAENLEAYIVAEVTEEKRVKMLHNGVLIADLSREFLSSNGAKKYSRAQIPVLSEYSPVYPGKDTESALKDILSDLRFCSQRGLQERFGSSIGAGTVLHPLGGKYQLTPQQCMAALLPAETREMKTASVMSFGFDPYHSEANPFAGARTAVISSVSKLVAAGCRLEDIYLSFQEYFGSLRGDPQRWGMPVSALLGALSAQLSLGVAAIGGKDSMSGSFMDLDVPPTLISFAVATCEARDVVSPEFKEAGGFVSLFAISEDGTGAREAFNRFSDLCAKGEVRAAWSVTAGSPLEGIFKMAVGNGIGFESDGGITAEELLRFAPGSIIVETAKPCEGAVPLGRTIAEPCLRVSGEETALADLIKIWEEPLEDIFPAKTENSGLVDAISYSGIQTLKRAPAKAAPRVVIPVFPGTNCEYDTGRAVRLAGGIPEYVLIRNLKPEYLEDSVLRLEQAVRNSQMIILPGGFSGGDEPDGSGKFIASFLRNPRITDAVHELLKVRDGLIMGICNGFQALIKLGLVPYGEIRDVDDSSPTLTFNTIGRHQSRYVTTRVASAKSPWFSKCEVGDLHRLLVDHGEGRFVATDEMLQMLIENGQVATQYTDDSGVPNMDVKYNPNGSILCIEGITSPDGRVYGKMCHAERRGEFVGKNMPGNKFQPVFESGVSYYL